MLGIGEKLIAKLIAAGLLKSPVDFYPLTEKQILDNIERQGEVSAKNIVAAIKARRTQTLETFLASLGIRGLGPAVAGRLAAHFHDLALLQKAGREELMRVEGVAETMAEVLHSGLADRGTLIAGLLQHVQLLAPEKISGVLEGKSFCLTGHVEFDCGGQHYDARPEIEKLIKSKGGAIKNVSKTLDYLVVGADPGSKVEKASKAGVKIIDAAGLRKLLE
jgi:DNA ligase (NAD+)